MHSNQSKHIPNCLFAQQCLYRSWILQRCNRYWRHGYSYKQNDEGLTQLYENTLSYQHKLSKLDINAIAGYSYQDFVYQGMKVGAGNFVTDLDRENFSAAQDFQNGLAV